MFKFMRAVLSVVCLVNAAPGSWPKHLRPPDKATRQLQTGTCNMVSLRLLPPPALTAFDNCFLDTMRPGSSHDWAVPGAEVQAQLQCWCQHNLTSTMEDFGCCDAADIYPLCSTQCDADCNSELAKKCVQTCPSMCFEAAEYIVNSSLCADCNWVTCWPVLTCLTEHATERVANGTLEKTCHETDFTGTPQLQNYLQCWYNAPKHSTHWNVMSSIVNCICREDMQAALNETDCCKSALYGGGACELPCIPEHVCVTQVAQTCVQTCQHKCPLFNKAPSEDCLKHCLNTDAPCRQYVSCRPSALPSDYMCDDAEWPEANSGCCVNEATNTIGCPKLCESRSFWRLDRRQGIPWWARWVDRGGSMVAQCTCTGCPSTEAGAQGKLIATVEEGLWDNGQIILVDIARREGLRYGPNRQMQELMATRNTQIAELIKTAGISSTELDNRIAIINAEYNLKIAEAARVWKDDVPSDGRGRGRGRGKGSHPEYIIVPIVCTILIVCALGYCIMRMRSSGDKCEETHTTYAGQQGTDVVIGQPVSGNPVNMNGVLGGMPVTVTVAAPTRQSPKGHEFSVAPSEPRSREAW